jgi:hypothetical protein
MTRGNGDELRWERTITGMQSEGFSTINDVPPEPVYLILVPQRNSDVKSAGHSRWKPRRSMVARSDARDLHV